MDELFSTEPVRPAVGRGEFTRPMRRAPRDNVWPPRDRDAADVAVVASRLLAASGRLTSRLQSTARRQRVDPYVLRLLLLFAESDRPLSINNVAELLGVAHSTASRAATRAYSAGLVDKFASPIDQREVNVRLSYPGRAAVTRCLDALRADAAEILGIGRANASHPRGQDLIALLGPPPQHWSSPNHGHGWRAGVRVGMHDQ